MHLTEFGLQGVQLVSVWVLGYGEQARNMYVVGSWGMYGFRVCRVCRVCMALHGASGALDGVVA